MLRDGVTVRLMDMGFGFADVLRDAAFDAGLRCSRERGDDFELVFGNWVEHFLDFLHEEAACKIMFDICSHSSHHYIRSSVFTWTVWTSTINIYSKFTHSPA